MCVHVHKSDDPPAGAKTCGPFYDRKGLPKNFGPGWNDGSVEGGGPPKTLGSSLDRHGGLPRNFSQAWNDVQNDGQGHCVLPKTLGPHSPPTVLDS